jgi:ATP-dependent protease Clp ATPase subunit
MVKKNGENEVLRCSFCNEDQNDVRTLIAGPTVFFCNECVEVCNDIIADDNRFDGQEDARLQGRCALGAVTDLGATFERVEPQDLIQYGLIPEFVGRLPIAAPLHELDRSALVQILTQPRNAITRQYQKLFEYENVKLRFNDDALEAIAESALERKTGARGLRMIIEEPMLDLMYSLPHQKKLRECVITREIVEAHDTRLSLLEKAG